MTALLEPGGVHLARYSALNGLSAFVTIRADIESLGTERRLVPVLVQLAAARR